MVGITTPLGFKAYESMDTKLSSDADAAATILAEDEL
jgi:hypothetical protein